MDTFLATWLPIFITLSSHFSKRYSETWLLELQCIIEFQSDFKSFSNEGGQTCEFSRFFVF